MRTFQQDSFFPRYCISINKQNKSKILIKDILKIFFVIIIPIFIVFLSAYGYFWGEIDEYVKEKPLGALHGGGDGHTIVALFETTTNNEFFTMLSGKHFLEFIGEHLLISPFGLYLLSLLALFYFNKLKNVTFLKFLVVMSFFFLIYTFIWNQDLCPYRDWDVYAPSAIPYTLLSALLLNYIAKTERDYYALSIIVISALHTIPWIIHNRFF